MMTSEFQSVISIQNIFKLIMSLSLNWFFKICVIIHSYPVTLASGLSWMFVDKEGFLQYTVQLHGIDEVAVVTLGSVGKHYFLTYIFHHYRNK